MSRHQGYFHAFTVMMHPDIIADEEKTEDIFT
jgi:hypothetical protein